MFHACGIYVSCLRHLCFTFAVSMFHACGLYVSCLRSLSTTHGYDKGRIAFWGARKRLGALAVLCGFERRACKHQGWVCAFWLVLFGRAFSGSFFGFVLFGRSFRGSCFWVRAFGRSFRGSCFLVVLFVVRSSGGSYVFFVRCFKSLRGVCGKVRGFLMQR